MGSRIDSDMRLLVDLAIVEHERGNTEKAITTLTAVGLSDVTIGRVLFDPSARRRYINDIVNNLNTDLQ